MEMVVQAEEISAVFPTRTENTEADVQRFGVRQAEQVRSYHATFPEYTVTPLVSLDRLAEACGVAGIYVKDESRRFGLNAFKALGGSYAIGMTLAEKLGVDAAEVNYPLLTSAQTREQLGQLTFITATDGNHGRGVAWTANRLGQSSVVYMPKGTAQERLENILALGSDASITEVNYDDAVRMAAKEAAEKGSILVQDTSWPGYETIPARIMQGYTTMGSELRQQLEELGGLRPTHLFLQAGVGSMAGAMAAYFTDLYGSGEEKPYMVVVEPNEADCLFRTAKHNDGTLHKVEGDMPTMMAGLACGEPCPLGWALLRDCADAFVAMPDEVAARGMRQLAHPVEWDTPVESGESGAAGFSLALELLQNPKLAELRSRMHLNADSRILCISTEGATDRENYRRIVQN